MALKPKALQGVGMKAATRKTPRVRTMEEDDGFRAASGGHPSAFLPSTDRENKLREIQRDAFKVIHFLISEVIIDTDTSWQIKNKVL